MIVGMPGGRQLALSVAGSSFFASSASKTFSSAADTGVSTGCSGGGPPGVGKSNVQIPAQSGSEARDAVFAFLGTAKVLAGCGVACPWDSVAKPAKADSTITIAGKNLMLAPFPKWRVANCMQKLCDGGHQPLRMKQNFKFR